VSTIETITDLSAVGLPPSLDVPAGVRRVLRAVADVAPQLKGPHLTLRTRDYDLLQQHFPGPLFWGPVRLIRGQPENHLTVY